MRNRLYWQLALRNLKANRRLVLPFVLSSAIMGALLYIMTNLLDNKFVNERHQFLIILMRFGVVLVTLFTIIFMLYSARLSRKNRNREIALYAVLGLEKKHISKILRIENFIQYLIVSILAIVGGQLFGLLTFAGMNKLMYIDVSVMGEYGFSAQAPLILLIIFAGIFTLIHLMAAVQVRISTPMELMQKQESSETEPKSNWLLAIIGIVLIAVGYRIALGVQGYLESMFYFFIAAIFVIFGTYFCFTAFSILILKAMRKKKSYYTKPTRFLSISGMLYRMKANGVGLASICIMLTALIITLGAVGSIYHNMENLVDTTMPYDYQFSGTKFELTASEQELNDYLEKTKLEISSINAQSNKEMAETSDSDDKQTANETEVDNKGVVDVSEIHAILNNYSYVADLNGKFEPVNSETLSLINHSFVKFYYYENYSQVNKSTEPLAADEIYMSTNNLNKAGQKTLIIGEKEYKVKPLPERPEGNMAADLYIVVLPNFETFKKYAELYQLQSADKVVETSTINSRFSWNISNQKIDLADYKASIRQILDSNDLVTPIDVRSEYRNELISMNGGFVFLGSLLGIIFILGTVLVTYYKQVSEAYEDQHNFTIMKQVGLPSKLIKQTTNSQVIWMFFLPLVVAVIHTLVASKILYQLLGLFGVYNWWTFGGIVGIVLIFIAVIYFLVFRITSKVYYKIVND